MKVQVQAGANQIRALHNLVCSIRNLLLEGEEVIGGLPADVAKAESDEVAAFRDQVAAIWCDAYRALPEGKEREALKEEFWFWSDLNE